MGEKVSAAIEELKKAMELENVDPMRGLPEELFIFSTTLVPIVNIDLFVTNDKHQLLLSWRDDIWHGRGWHIPGGCVRLKENLETRVIKTAEKELRVPIVFNPDPIAVREIIEPDNRPNLSNQMERCHNISFLYSCKVKNGFKVKDVVDGVKMQWFDKLPDELLKTHINLYGDVIENYFNGGTKND